MSPLPQLGEAHVVYVDPQRSIYRQTADFGEFTKEYFVHDSGERAGIIVIHDSAVLLVRQYRLLINGLSWEIPGGRIDAGESPAEAAVRECAEETGVHCRAVQPLLFFLPGLDTSRNPTHLFSSSDFTRDANHIPHSGEVEVIEWVPLVECLRMIHDGEIMDSMTALAMLSYHAFVINGAAGRRR